MEKIALEEHFGVPELPEYSAIGKYGFRPEDAKDISQKLYDFDDLRLAAMEEGGISKTVISHTNPGIETAVHAGKAVKDARTINDYLRKQLDRHPDRFAGFATLAMHDPAAAADELERCVKQLGFLGAHLNGHTHGHYLDEDRYRGFFERVESLGVPIYLHPTTAFQVPQNFQDHPELLGALWGWTPETATHVLRMVFSGLFDRFPAVQIIIGHGGETLPYLLWRLDKRFMLNSFGLTIKNLPSHYLRQNVSITTSGLFSTPALQCALELLGEDRVMFSVDYPFESSKEAGEWFDRLELPAATLAKVASGNAKRLLKLA